MNPQFKNQILCTAIGTFVCMGNVQAALFDRGGGMIYDDALNITWLQDADYAKTSGYDADGLLPWSEAVAWADGLVYGSFSDWRLPGTTDAGNDGCAEFSTIGGTDCGLRPDPNTSEMAHIFYVTLGNKGIPDADAGIKNAGPFLNLAGHEGYWSGTSDISNPTLAAWAFGTDGTQPGHQDTHLKSIPLNAWAVRDGDVIVAIPEPSTGAMLLTGLLALSLFVRKRT